MKLDRSIRQEKLSEVIGEGLDRLSTIDFHGRGIVAPIYNAARKACGGFPLTYSFAKALIERAEQKRAAVVATGFMIRRAMQPETDGLTGSAYLARVMSDGLGLVPMLMCEEEAGRAARACFEAAGLVMADVSAFEEDRCPLGAYLYNPLPSGEGAQESEDFKKAASLLKRANPCIFMTIERSGMNEKGVPHTTFGMSTADINAPMDAVMEIMKQRGIPTFAVGDMGNELGMGKVKDVVEKITPFGSRCNCGCGAGVAAVMQADYTMMGSISDDACYAIGASVAQQLGRIDLLPDPEVMRAILVAAVTNGAVDGLTAQSELSIDMLPWKEHERLIGLIRAQVESSLRHDCDRPQFIDHILGSS